MAVSRAKPVGHHAQHPLHQLVHQRRALGRQQIAQHQHNCSVQQHCTQTAGDKCTKLLCHRSASGLAVEHKGPVGGVGKQDAEDVVQHIAPAVGGGVAEQIVEQGIQHNIQQGGQHAENQVGDDLPVLFKNFYHGFVNKNSPAAVTRQRGCSRIVSETQRTTD